MSTAAKEIACGEINNLDANLRKISLDIWNNPELCFEEHHAHKILTDFLETKDFLVERHFKLDTAFKATFSSKCVTENTPTIGVMCEYDALPGIGHACGHNLIAIMGVAIACGIKAALQDGQVEGKLIVFGCPAEEGGGGKIDLINAGAFDDLDVAMMGHPSQFSLPRPIMVGMTPVTATFKGCASHASSAPWEGVNALDAAVLCYQNISCMRQHFKSTWRAHGIFTQAGEKPNIIPESAELFYYLRAPSAPDMAELKKKISICIEGAAVSTGCTVDYKFGSKAYVPVLSNPSLASLYEANGKSLGIVYETDPIRQMKQGGSTDMGNVSVIIPSIHPKFSINTLAPGHSEAFRDQAKTEEAHDLTLIHSKAMAMAAIDVFSSPTLLASIKSDFEKQMGTS